MKFAVVVVLIALALGAQSSVIPIGPISLVQGPAVVAAHSLPGSVAIQASVVPAPVKLIQVAHPQIVLAQGPAVLAPAPVVAVAPAEGTYVAKTRGAVHVAPLPGHAQSAASVNLEPAPGTI